MPFSSRVKSALFGAAGLLLPLIAAIGMPGSAASQTECNPVDNAVYRIQNVGTGHDLAVDGGSRQQGANVIQWPWVGQRDALWRLERHTLGAFKVRNIKSGLYLAIAGGSGGQGASAIQWTDVGQEDVRWFFEHATIHSDSAALPLCNLRNASSGMYLAVEGSSTFNGANVIQWAHVGQRDIRWTIRRQ